MGTRTISQSINLQNPDVSKYITKISDAGIRIHPASTEDNSVVINASGMEVFKGGTTDEYSIAKYGDTARIGTESGSHFVMNTASLQAFNASGTKYFEVSASGITFGSNSAATQSAVETAQSTANTAKTNAATAQTTATNAAKTATNYLSYDSTNGLKIAGSSPSSTTSNYIQITSSIINIIKDSTHKATINTDGLKIYSGDASNPVASFGSTVLLGQSNQYQLSIDASKVKFLNRGTEIGSIQAINGFFDILGPNVGIASSASNGSSVYCTSNKAYIQSTDEIQLNTETLHIYASTPSHYPNGLTLISHDVDCENSLQVEGTFYNGSDKKLKDNISSINFAEELIMNLKPVTYMFKKGKHIRKHMGLIAQEVAATCIELQENLSLVRAQYNEKTTGEYYGERVDDNLLKWSLAYQELIAPMIQVIQSQNKQLKEQYKEIEQLKKEVAELKK